MYVRGGKLHEPVTPCKSHDKLWKVSLEVNPRHKRSLSCSVKRKGELRHCSRLIWRLSCCSLPPCFPRFMLPPPSFAWGACLLPLLPLPPRALPSASFPWHVAHHQPAPGTASLPTAPPLTLPSTSAASLPSPEGSLFIQGGKCSCWDWKYFVTFFYLSTRHFYLCSLETYATVGLILSTYSMHFSSIMITELLHNILGIADFLGFVALYLPKHLKRNLSVIGML